MNSIEALEILKYITKPSKKDKGFLAGIEAWARGGKPLSKKQAWRLQLAYRRSQESEYVKKEMFRR